MEWLIPAIVVVVVVLAILGLYLWLSYRSLVQLNARVNEAWGELDASLHERAELVPELIHSVMGPASHEKAVFETLTRARSSLLSAESPVAAAQAEVALQRGVRRLLTVAEGYPQLQRDADFLAQQQRMSTLSDSVQGARRIYNGGVREFNGKIVVFPSTLFVKKLGLTEREFFDSVDGSAVAEAPRIKF